MANKRIDKGSQRYIRRLDCITPIPHDIRLNSSCNVHMIIYMKMKNSGDSLRSRYETVKSWLKANPRFINLLEFHVKNEKKILNFFLELLLSFMASSFETSSTCFIYSNYLLQYLKCFLSRCIPHYAGKQLNVEQRRSTPGFVLLTE